jgi:hypothetical protein
LYPKLMEREGPKYIEAEPRGSEEMEEEDQ